MYPKITYTSAPTRVVNCIVKLFPVLYFTILPFSKHNMQTAWKAFLLSQYCHKYCFSIPPSLSCNMEKVFHNFNYTNGYQKKWRLNYRFTVASPRWRRNINVLYNIYIFFSFFLFFSPLLCWIREENLLKYVLHLQHDYLSEVLFTPIHHCIVVFPLPRRSSLRLPCVNMHQRNFYLGLFKHRHNPSAKLN